MVLGINLDDRKDQERKLSGPEQAQAGTRGDVSDGNFDESSLRSRVNELGESVVTHFDDGHDSTDEFVHDSEPRAMIELDSSDPDQGTDSYPEDKLSEGQKRGQFTNAEGGYLDPEYVRANAGWKFVTLGDPGTRDGGEYLKKCLKSSGRIVPGVGRDGAGNSNNPVSDWDFGFMDGDDFYENGIIKGSNDKFFDTIYTDLI